ncbi:MAG: MMPL family transporter [Deltaproteobacteria bacterium]|nr:MMPL family transporter [Deltaproteobacteria bacterium]
MRGSSARVRAFVAWTLRHGRLLWMLALLLAIPATVRTARMYASLRSDLEQLLPRDAPSVHAIEELRARMPGLQHLGVIVDVGGAQNLPAGERLLDDLAARVRTYPKALVRAVRVGDAEERAFLESHAPLYLDLEDLQTIHDRLEDRRDWEVAKKTGSLLSDEGPPPLDFADLEKKYAARAGGRRSERGRFSSAEQKTTLLLIEVAEASGGRGKGQELLDRVKADLAALGGPDRYAPGMRLGFTGDVAISVEETSALMADLSLSSVVVALLVIASLVLYFRWWRSVLVLLAPLLLATVYAFALASLPPFRVTELNSNTAFLGSIVVGNGINFGIMLLARHVEERRRGVATADALTTAVAFARPGTLAAALASSVSYASLIVTDFRGFEQFGYIGGLGMVISWVTAFVLIPPLTLWLDRGEHVRPSRRTGAMERLGRLVAARPGVFVTVGALLLAAAAVELRHIGPHQLETDFSKLRRRDTWTSGEGLWGRRMDALLGTYLTPMVVLTDAPDDARRVAQALRDAATRPPLQGMIASIRTIDDVLPADQEKKIALAEGIRKMLTPNIRANLSEEHRASIERFLGSGPLEAISAANLPATFTIGLRERDGTLGQSVVVYPVPSRALWQGEQLGALVSTIRGVSSATVSSGSPRVAGSLPLSADIVDSMRRDGVRATATALGGVLVVVLALFGARRASGLVVASLLTGVAWLAALGIAFGVKVNFANFIAYPITFGIGVDYAVNVASRFREDGDTAAAVASTGGAVALCSATTVIGYSSLLLAQNQALFLFGVLAVLGEITCLVAAITLLPAALAWVSRRRPPAEPKVRRSSGAENIGRMAPRTDGTTHA